MAGFRMGRINSQLQREISHILASVIKEDRVRDAIITSVDCTRDLKFAKVYYTTLEDKGRQGLAKALERVSSAVRRTLGQQLRLRTVPELQFLFDETERRARQMDQILDQVASELPQLDDLEADDQAADLPRDQDHDR